MTFNILKGICTQYFITPCVTSKINLKYNAAMIDKLPSQFLIAVMKKYKSSAKIFFF